MIGLGCIDAPLDPKDGLIELEGVGNNGYVTRILVFREVLKFTDGFTQPYTRTRLSLMAP